MLPKYEIYVKKENTSYPVWKIEWDEEYLNDSIFIFYGKPFEPRTFLRLYKNSKDYILKQIGVNNGKSLLPTVKKRMP